MSNNYFPLISVITPCYNAEKYLAETLDSVIAQTYTNWECIVVNDGSTDNSESVAMNYVAADPRIKYIAQSNQGPSVARNNAIEHSHGVFILPLDADDIIEPSYMEKAIKHFQEVPKTKLVYCRIDYLGERTGEWILPKFEYDNFIHQNCLFASSFFRRSDFDKAGGYNPDMREGLEDWELWLEMIRPNDIVFQIDEILFHYRIRSVARNISAWEKGKILHKKMRAIKSPEYQFAMTRFYSRKAIIMWPFKIFSQKYTRLYKEYYQEKWKLYRKHDIIQNLIYPYMVIYRRVKKWLNIIKNIR